MDRGALQDGARSAPNLLEIWARGHSSSMVPNGSACSKRPASWSIQPLQEQGDGTALDKTNQSPHRRMRPPKAFALPNY
ncbi:hypothetical protein THARTR1_00098 [Trichoderma harzianum]|uniref:Uncharacterized protein n=1 Tax=Trichoderma harzianum TaxID=5544 RepID=A0A2K0UQM3_TRIHA|nr:hypothetical protein THARTR1_00098 [Trichoderma harzianum]